MTRGPLPDYVTSFRDRHGKVRYRYRRKGYASAYFKGAIGSKEFWSEYDAFVKASLPAPAIGAAAIAPGTIDDLVTRYLTTPTRLGPTATTQAKIRAILSRFRSDHGGKPVALIEFEHIDAIIAARLAKVQVGKRVEGGVEAARKLRKELVRLFDFAVKLRMRESNPVRQAERVKVAAGERTKGFYSWTEADIAQFRACHTLGTKPRLALELMLWTDQRRIDAIRMGRQHIRNGRINVIQSKTGKDLWIAVAPQLLAAIVAMPPLDQHLCFLVTEQGRPFTNAGFGNWFRDQCDDAGLPQCAAHGLRKATMRRMAELGLSNQSMKAVSGHEKDTEVARYTAAANQVRLADDAMIRLARWESNLGSDEMSNLDQAPDFSRKL